MTLPHGTDRLESARLVLRRIEPDDLPFFTRLHALPEVARHLYPGGRPRSPAETAAWLQTTLATYEQLALGYLAVLRKADGALIGRCGLMELVVESAAPGHGLRRGWFGLDGVPADVELTFECELGYTFDPAVWGQGFATEAARCVRDYARDVLGLPYAISAILPDNARSRRVAERSGARAAGQMEVLGLTWDRWRWPLASPRTPKEISMATTTLATWIIDPVHSSVEFSLDYMGFSTYRTGFRALEGTLAFDAARPAASSVTASIPVASIDVTNDRLMSRLMDPDLLGGRDHPTITFRSTRVEALDPARWTVTGDLTMHGVTRPVVLDTRYLGQAKHPFSGKIAAAFRAETTIDRREFGVTWNAAMDAGGAYLGERVQISLTILAARQD